MKYNEFLFYINETIKDNNKTIWIEEFEDFKQANKKLVEELNKGNKDEESIMSF